MPLVQTRGAASAQGFGEFAQAAGPVTYVEDVFNTWVYTGTSATQNIPNGIDLAGKGGLIWTKFRSGSFGTEQHALMDTVRGANNWIDTADNGAQITYANMLTSFNSNGYTLGSDSVGGKVNWSAQNYCSWTFREQAKFFDIVTYTGNSTNRTIAHNLGSAPGMIIVKSTTQTSNWQVYHRSLTSASYAIQLNNTAAEASFPTIWNSTAPTSTEFSIGTSSSVNLSGETFVAYLFAHDAGGFGTAGTDNVISCGSYTGAASDVAVSLGYEPQYLLVKNASSTTNWYMVDIMRGLYGTTTPESYLYPNSSNAEATDSNRLTITSTGFIARAGTTTINDTGNTYIYMAIRRPMKVPTTGTSVFSPVARTGNGSTASITGINFAPDVLLCSSRAGYWEASFNDRLRGFDRTLYTQLTSAESTNATSVTAMGNTSISLGAFGSVNASGQTYINWILRRAAGFFDEVCYTGTGSYSGQNQSHNLGVVPELMIVKSRTQGTGRNWAVYSAALGATKYLSLNLQNAEAANYTFWNNTTPTSSVFTVNGSNETGNTSENYVAYLFATCAGVSKVGSYTGNGGTQAIACGFTGGARFVLIKRTDATGDWYVYDTVRGMTLLTDPYLLLNFLAAETATLGSVTTTTGGFTVDATILAAINTNAASYIFLAIA